jgi:hypothetical protein
MLVWTRILQAQIIMPKALLASSCCENIFGSSENEHYRKKSQENPCVLKPQPSKFLLGSSPSKNAFVTR